MCECSSDFILFESLQIRVILMKSDELKTNIQKDFEFSYFDDIDDALIERLSQNQDFSYCYYLMIKWNVRCLVFSLMKYIKICVMHN